MDANAEEKFVRDLDDELSLTVFSAGCSNWYINKAGRNSAAWPGLAATFWKATLFPRWKDFVTQGGSIWWPFRKAFRNLRRRSSFIVLAVLAVAAGKFLASSGALPAPALALVNRIRLPVFSMEKMKALLGYVPSIVQS